MSHDATNWAIKQKGVKPAAKIVLWHMCDRYHPDHGCFPALDTLAKDCEMSRRSVQNQIDILEDAGLLAVEKMPRENGRLPRNRYRFPFENGFPEAQKSLGQNLPKAKSALGKNEHSPLAKNDAHLGQNLPTNPVREPVIEPVSAREAREGDLFSETEPTPENGDGRDKEAEKIEEGFETFWRAIWPSHPRKTGKADCLKVYTAACKGKHPKADKVSPAELNRCAKAYVASVRDRQFLKGPLPWLRLPGWEPFLGTGSGEEYREDALTPTRRSMLEDGICPPSMKGPDGRPNAEAAYWLKRYGHGVPA